MDYGRLGERQRGPQLPMLEIGASILILVAIVLTMIDLVRYSDRRDELPTDLTVAGVAVGGLSETDAMARWESIYIEQPLQLFYEGNPIVLLPAEINFRTNNEAMLAEARAQSSREQNFWIGFWNYLEHKPIAAVQVPLDASYPEDNLREYLTTIAERYDTQSGEAGFDTMTLSFHSGTMGHHLDSEAALALIDQALFDPNPEHRRVVLPTTTTDATTHDMNTLQEAVFALMQSRGFVYNGLDTVASVYIMDLATGEEISILADVPHSAVSTIKVPIMVNLFREELLVPNGSDVAYLLTESILCSNNASSNLLMQVAGNGLSENEMLRDGLNQVSCTAQSLGAEHTYISAPLDVDDSELEFEVPVCRPSTPGNAAYNTEADLFSQTTAEDMGLLLTQIYDCANFGSGLMAIYPDEITQAECRQMIELLSGVRIDRLLELGIPLGTRIAHKNGWGPPGVSADAAIIFSPGGDYVLVVYTYERDLDGNGLPTLAAWELIEEISRLVYNYFNPAQPLLQPRTPLNPMGAIDCVTAAYPEQVNLDDINANRVDEQGMPLPTACYAGAGNCRPFDNWGQ